MGLGCLSGLCLPACGDACTSGARRCTQAGGVEGCFAGPGPCTHWQSVVDACGATARCVDGRCIDRCPGACRPGVARCDGSRAYDCLLPADGGCPFERQGSEAVDLRCRPGACSDSYCWESPWPQGNPVVAMAVGADGRLLLLDAQGSVISEEGPNEPWTIDLSIRSRDRGAFSTSFREPPPFFPDSFSPGEPLVGRVCGATGMAAFIDRGGDGWVRREPGAWERGGVGNFGGRLSGTPVCGPGGVLFGGGGDGGVTLSWSPFGFGAPDIQLPVFSLDPQRHFLSSPATRTPLVLAASPQLGLFDAGLPRHAAFGTFDGVGLCELDPTGLVSATGLKPVCIVRSGWTLPAAVGALTWTAAGRLIAGVAGGAMYELLPDGGTTPMGRLPSTALELVVNGERLLAQTAEGQLLTTTLQGASAPEWQRAGQGRGPPREQVAALLAEALDAGDFGTHSNLSLSLPGPWLELPPAALGPDGTVWWGTAGTPRVERCRPRDGGLGSCTFGPQLGIPATPSDLLASASWVGPDGEPHVLAVGSDGTAMRRDRDGWHAEPTPAGGELRSVRVGTDGRAWAVGEAGTVLTRSSGGSWAEGPSTDPFYELNDIFPASGVLTVSGRDGTLLRLEDGARDWSEVAPPGVGFATLGRFTWPASGLPRRGEEEVAGDACAVHSRRRGADFLSDTPCSRLGLFGRGSEEIDLRDGASLGAYGRVFGGAPLRYANGPPFSRGLLVVDREVTGEPHVTRAIPLAEGRSGRRMRIPDLSVVSVLAEPAGFTAVDSRGRVSRFRFTPNVDRLGEDETTEPTPALDGAVRGASADADALTLVGRGGLILRFRSR